MTLSVIVLNTVKRNKIDNTKLRKTKTLRKLKVKMKNLAIRNWGADSFQFSAEVGEGWTGWSARHPDGQDARGPH